MTRRKVVGFWNPASASPALSDLVSRQDGWPDTFEGFRQALRVAGWSVVLEASVVSPSRVYVEVEDDSGAATIRRNDLKLAMSFGHGKVPWKDISAPNARHWAKRFGLDFEAEMKAMVGDPNGPRMMQLSCMVRDDLRGSASDVARVVFELAPLMGMVPRPWHELIELIEAMEAPAPAIALEDLVAMAVATDGVLGRDDIDPSYRSKLESLQLALDKVRRVPQ